MSLNKISSPYFQWWGCGGCPQRALSSFWQGWRSSLPGAKLGQRSGSLPARKKASAPGSLRISSMSRFNGQVFVSWATSSSCQMAVAETVCFSRTADIRELKPPEPESCFTSFSMTFKMWHKNTVRDFLATRQVAKLQVGVLGYSGRISGEGFFNILHLPAWETFIRDQVLHTSLWMPFLLLRKLQLPTYCCALEIKSSCFLSPLLTP